MLSKYYNTSSKTIVYSDGGKIIGEIKDSIFTKFKWHSSKHLCHKYNAIGLDSGALAFIIGLAFLMRVYDLDTGKTYEISIDDFQRYGIEDDLGWGSQIFCPITRFCIQEPDSSRPLQLTFALEGCNG